MLTASPSKVIYQGDGNTTAFGFSIPLPAGSTGSELQVWIADNASPPNLTLLTGNYSVNVTTGIVNYPTVAGIAPLAAAVAALPVGWQIVIARVVPMSQPLSILSQGVFDGPSFAAELDRLTMICQQLAEVVARGLQYPINVVPSAQQLDPSQLTVSISPLIFNGTQSQCVAKAAAAPTTQFLCFGTDLGAAGTFGFYTGNATAGPNGDGFIWVGGA